MARIFSGGVAGAPARMLELDTDLQTLSMDEMRARLDFLRGNRSMIPQSAKGGKRTKTVKAAKPAIEEEAM